VVETHGGIAANQVSRTTASAMDVSTGGSGVKSAAHAALGSGKG